MKQKIRQLALPGFELADYIADSIAFLQKNEPQEGYFVGFSGGKDSIVTLDLVKQSGVKYSAGYSCTGIDYPEIPRFIRRYYPEVVFYSPKESYWSLLRKNGPPMRMIRWCCRILKEEDSHKECVFGLRAEESYKRAVRGRISTYQGKTIYKPIFHWPEWAVWQYIEENSLPYPTLYDEGASRIGCIGCPFALCGRSEAKAIRRRKEMQRFPSWYKIHRKILREWFERTRQANPDKYPIQDFETFYQNYWLT